MQRQHTWTVEKQTGQVIPWVFNRKRREIKSYDTA
jgi:hypothetical protein